MRFFRNLFSVVMFTMIFMAVLLSVREYAYDHWSPYLIDYNAPGVDITSEGPDDWDPWYEMGGETDADPDAHL